MQTNRYDTQLAEVIRYTVSQKTVSGTAIQQQFHRGYQRAGKQLDQMRELGIISEQQGYLDHVVLASKEEAENIIETRIKKKQPSWKQLRKQQNKHPFKIK
jgi:DNA segregation ATPase FtsK/SpoIIIE-like protein